MDNGILSGLRSVTMPVYAKDERGDFYPMTNAITWVKCDDVREALRGKAIVDAADLYLVLYTSGTVERSEAFCRLCDAVDATAGGDDECTDLPEPYLTPTEEWAAGEISMYGDS